MASDKSKSEQPKEQSQKDTTPDVQNPSGPFTMAEGQAIFKGGKSSGKNK